MMVAATCPECEYGLADMRLGHEHEDADTAYRCLDCDHEWKT